MQPMSRSYDPVTAGTGPQEPINLDYMPSAEAFVGVYVTDTAEFGVEFTLDDVNDPDATPRWFELKEIPIGSVNTTYASFTYPARFVRLNIVTFTGPLEFKVAQSADSRC